MATKAQLKAALANAENQFADARFIDNFVRMQHEQARWEAEINRLKGMLVRGEYEPIRL
jgi:hypothetical protein